MGEGSQTGTPERIIRTLARMASRISGRVIAGDIKSGEFSIRAGMPQGRTLSHQLYNVMIDDLFAALMRAGVEVMGGGGLVDMADGQSIPSL